MKENKVKIGDTVYVLIGLSSYDLQIVKYKVKYKGTDKFIPEGFQNLRERFQEIPYDNCYESLEAVKKAIPVDVFIVEHSSGDYYDVVLAN